MNLRTVLCLVALAAPAVVAACGGGQKEPATPPAPSASASSEPAPSASASASAEPVASAAPSASAAATPPGPPGPGDWDKWSHDQKLEYMKSDVMPKMGQLFHDFDAKRYEETKCVLCHGAGAKDGSFKMPNPELPKLDLTPAGFKKMMAKKPKVTEFMLKHVEPTMAGLLGEPVFDPKTKEGFGCTGCHTVVDHAGKPGPKTAPSATPAPKP